MPDKLSPETYQNVTAQCAYSLLRHPSRSLAERLAELLPLAEQFEQPDVYGKGQLVAELEQHVAALLGQPAALFMPSGTMSQPMALKIWSQQKRNYRVAFHPTCHLELHEQNGYKELYGLDAELIGAPEQVITLTDLQALQRPVSAVLLELPMREIGGQLPTWNELQAQTQWGKDNNTAMHLDGARLWSCESYYQKSLAEIGALFDSVYVSFYKDLGGISGAMLAGSEEFIAEARIWQRRCGGNLYSMFPEILAARQGLANHLSKLPQYVAKAQFIAAMFRRAKFKVNAGIRVIPDNPPCNLFHLEISQAPDELMPKVMQWSEKHDVALLPWPRAITKSRCRFEVTIGDNALQLSDAEWQSLITNFINAITND